MAFTNAKNRVPELQRAYQAAYKNHTRLWMIGSRSRWIVFPYTALLFGTTTATLYGLTRVALGKKSWI